MRDITVPASAAGPIDAPLQPARDQAEHWHACNSPLPFEVAADRILQAHREDGERDDVIVHRLQSWAFGSAGRGTMALAPVPFDGRPAKEPLLLRELAFSQLCTKIGAPASYIRALSPRLQTACMNWGMVRQDGATLLRLAGGEVRAVLSDKYAAADDALLLDLVGDTLDKAGYRDDARVRALALGTHTVLRITIPNEGTPVKVGDVIEHGIDIGNSELGLRSVQVTPVTYRLVCLNGMRAWRSDAALRMRHIGDPDRLRDQLRDAVPLAFAQARGDIERWKRAVDTLVDSALDEIEALRALGLSQGEVRAVANSFADEHGAGAADRMDVAESLRMRTTAFSVANSITAAAKARENVPGRLALEEAGHRYLCSRTK